MPHLALRFNWRENAGARGAARTAAMTLVYLAIAFVCGVLTGYVLRSEGVFSCATPVQVFAGAAALPIAALLLLRRYPTARRAAAVILFLALGAWRYGADPFDPCFQPADLPFWQTEEGVWSTVEGVVVGYPQTRDRGTGYDLAVDTLTVEGRVRRVEGRAWIEAPRYPPFEYGDRLLVRGLILTPPDSDDFNYRRYLAQRGIHTLIRRPRIEQLASGSGTRFWRGLYAFRSRASQVINRSLPEPAASLTNGMVLGIEGGIPKQVDDAFVATGTSHLIVISGSNIAFLAGALIAALGAVLSRRRAALAAAPVILLYVLLVGADPPALRAGVMGLLGLGAIFFGRRATAYVSLCAAGLVMLALNPLTLWDIGFQLSFLASLGLILFSRPLSRALLQASRRVLPSEQAKRVTRILEGTLIVTVAAQAAVLPLILLHFGSLSPVSLLANVLVLPVQPAILAGGIAALLGGLAWQPLGLALGVAPWLFLTYMVRVIEGLAAIPFASVDVGRVDPLFAPAYYLLLAAALHFRRIRALLRRHPDARLAGGWMAVIAVPVAFTLFLWRGQPDGRLRVVFVPGQGGEAAVIVAPNGRTVWMWDGRGNGAELAHAARRGGWVRGQPDLVIGGCESGPWSTAPCADPASLAPETVIALASDLHLTRLASEAEPAWLLTYGQFRTLLPATLSPAGQSGLPAMDGLTVLKTAGPETNAWPTESFLRATRPQVALWPLETTYPPSVSAALETETAALRIPAEAAVEVLSDGERFWLYRHSAAAPR